MSKRSAQDLALLSGRAAELFERGLSTTEIAEALSVSVRSVQRWRKNPVLPTPTPSPTSTPDEPALETEILPPDESRSEELGSLYDLIPAAIEELHRILGSSDSRTADKLKACQVIGDWSGLSGGLEGSVRRCHLAGYIVTDPTVKPRESKQQGLTEEGADLIKRKILFGE